MLVMGIRSPAAERAVPIAPYSWARTSAADADHLAEAPPHRHAAIPDPHVEVDAFPVDARQLGIVGLDAPGRVASDQQHRVRMVRVEMLDRHVEIGEGVTVEIGGRHRLVRYADQ